MFYYVINSKNILIFFSDDFAIPELPTGQKLSFVLLSPWDDPFYMGLNAIEIFTKDGIRPEILNVIFFYRYII